MSEVGSDEKKGKGFSGLASKVSSISDARGATSHLSDDGGGLDLASTITEVESVLRSAPEATTHDAETNESVAEPKNKGFAGLSSRVSEVPTSSSGSTPPPSPPPHQVQPPESPKSDSSPYGGSSSGASGRSKQGWVIGAVVLVIVWLIASSGGKKEAPRVPNYETPTYQTPSYSSAKPSPPPEPIADTQRPPVGRNEVLNTQQIRYCAKEKIRVAAIESVINNAYEREIDRFNAMVQDYNSRCGEFRYRRGAVESVQREVDLQRETITSTAKSEWVRGSLGLESPSGATKQRAVKSEAVQRGRTSCSNDGECAGGLYCVKGKCGQQVNTGGVCERNTECAGLTSKCLSGRCVGDGGNTSVSIQKPSPGKCQSDGECPGALYCVRGKCGEQGGIGSLCNRDTECAGLSTRCVAGRCSNSSSSYSPSPSYSPPSAPTVSAPSRQKGGIPANAELDYSGNDWRCVQGYRKSGNECISVQIPMNGELDYSGHDWRCKEGYRKSGRDCLPVQIPMNGELDYSGHDWRCKQGYRKSGNECAGVGLPPNAELDYSGHDWRCQQGFRKSGSNCLPVVVPQNGELDYSGHDWRCKQGYKRAGNECVYI